MNRTPSRLAQYSFDLSNSLQYLAKHARLPVRSFARVARKLAMPISRQLGAHHLVTAHLYGHKLLMPAEHPLAPTLAIFPQLNRPLALAAQAMECDPANAPLIVVDVGANIGETIAIIEQRCGGGHYLCIEADQEIAELCRANHASNSRVQVEQRFIGESDGIAVRLQDDGRANPSTKLAVEGDEGAGYDRLVRLDTVAGPFAELHGRLSLLKVDTEGYDFSVLRSAPEILKRYSPALFFEWFPDLLTGLGEDVWSGFEYLRTLGYRYYIFFTSQGDYYCAAADPERLLIHSLAAVVQNRKLFDYFDVFASTDKSVYENLIRLSTLREEAIS
jgi:FkbM family methyltransferase